MRIKHSKIFRTSSKYLYLPGSIGNVEQLVLLWLEVRINLISPFEVAAGNDVVAIREMYGKDLIIGDGIDIRALIKGKEAIREEAMSKVPFLLEQGVTSQL